MKGKYLLRILEGKQLLLNLLKKLLIILSEIWRLKRKFFFYFFKSKKLNEIIIIIFFVFTFFRTKNKKLRINIFVRIYFDATEDM